ncbi:MAG: CDP-alcohol phosphatidyltransferase family protein [Candidatus Pacebacteria bacterium]|nr:CDP-alcohol phosphatidyltransferase family protein [Candidatus Paceibacterota bacterium]
MPRLDLKRDKFKWLEAALAKIFSVIPLKPNHYTALSIIVAAAGVYLMIVGSYWAALVSFFLAGLLDLVDGAIARAKGMATAKGAHLDNLADRYVEGAFLFSLLFVPLPGYYLPAAAWIFLAIFGGTMTTYAKASAKEKGLSETDLKGGVMSRAERFLACLMILAFVGSGNGIWASYLLAALAVLVNITALQRIFASLRL